MSLDVTARARRGDFELDVELHVPSGRVLAVVGPNGAGKSTLLDLIAGHLEPLSGTVAVDGVPVAGAGAWVPAHRRHIALLGQDPLLFPHLDARDNIAFGPRAAGTGKAQARAEAETLLDRVGLTGLGRRTPARLSGGQQQRVAIARALAVKPRVLLLDEPFAALDVHTAPLLRQRLSTDATGVTMVLVTHDMVDAVALADDVTVLDRGRVIEQGPVTEVFGAPRTAFTAALVGTNLVDTAALGAGPAGLARVAPRAVELDGDDAAPGGYAWDLTVVGLERSGTSIRVRLASPSGAELLADVDLVRAADLRPGQAVRARVAQDAVEPVAAS